MIAYEVWRHLEARTIPPPDAALGAGLARSASQPTSFRQIEYFS
ncbi:MAG TPA: hypothetical protein VG347_16385 [Verrucomicrobiae bacterium]|nr:hypothetical protein [Verrucomicrobiae bacterium]